SGTPRPAAGAGEAVSGAGAEAGASAEGSDGSAAGTATPRAHAYGGLLVNGDNSISLSEGTMREDRKGDIRFDCANASCALESDSSVFMMLFGDPGATYEECRRMTAGREPSHRLPLAAASAGQEICVRRDNGDIALLVVQVKSTAMPDSAFVTVDTTVWPAKRD
ncbi:serine/threonine protein kinase, partial [Streptomyces diastaticus]|nr:serine/threonine protein kinase [Streptomyces diastaticus]